MNIENYYTKKDIEKALTLHIDFYIDIPGDSYPCVCEDSEGNIISFYIGRQTNTNALTGYDEHYPQKPSKIDRFCQYLERKGLSWDYGENLDGENVFITDWNECNCDSWIESLGYEIWWDDTSIRCENCSKFVNTQPAYYGDIVKYKFVEDHISCTGCMEKDIKEYGLDSDYFEYFVDNVNDCLNWHLISTDDLEKLGYTLAFDNMENGFHQGQTDTPQEAIDRYMLDNDLDSMPYHVFYLDTVGQFDVSFSMYVLRYEV